MSIGPPALGNVLVQRLDAVLGTTMAAHANLLTGARPDAVAQPGEAARPGQSESATRRLPQEGVSARSGQAALVDAKTAAALALAARGMVTRADTTPSAPTTLGSTARMILSLLAQYPDAPPVQGRAPLWSEPPTAAAASQTPDAQPNLPGRPDITAGKPGLAPKAAPVTQNGEPATNAARQAAQTTQSEAAQNIQAAARPSAALLAQALRTGLQNSGLFYESHLTDMAYGQRTPESLRAEPQAGLPRAPQVAPTPPSLPAHAATTQSNTPPATSPTSSAVLTLSSQADIGPPPAPGTPIGGIHPDTNSLVRQQLEVLANHVIQWQGEPWPGADMEWEVRRDPYGEAQEDPDSHWATRLTLHLPRLGQIEARLSLAGDQLVLQLTAPQSAQELGQASDGLRQQLSHAGLTLSNLTVQAMEPVVFQLPDFF
ncbi:flagellar hook-length control protein FliK [Bordetella avium]|uniref:flagellar hook-length control protein FliK n=1 Tax=Bordetella avium TaxID=521 RepID=UPI000E0C2AFB|nr:flagellar hook-length control protein FliK [Bordetella avium]AZY49095.1 flagellar hook-length control protein FliK [Bordetella avium]RIQ35963.1 flagellar hook-length control protein FliK [Bordetella avium]RIQ40208.1 flagellar hook-length control protein FliK [Bordetella avium]RIQ41628.1 flagellar hook-length control protein FliK [Bordetella avium]RIQ47526.1 flagellar hook-length control protein FliK [Bordetella avium]